MPRRTMVPFGVSLLVLALVAGCRSAGLASLERRAPLPVAPATSLVVDTEGQAFYPLVLGNRWHYTRKFDAHWVDASGAPLEIHQVSAIERELVCQTSSRGLPDSLTAHSYTVERTLESADQVYTSWVYYRQDRSGLFEYDYSFPPPCASSPGIGLALRATPLSSIADPGLPSDPGVRAAIVTLQKRLALVRYTLGVPAPSLHHPRPAAGEIVRLAYPMRTGQRWIIRGEPRFTASVEGVNSLDLPAGHFVAYRIRIDSDLFGPNDRVLVWYGREGFLRLDFHGESQGRDENGNPTGLVTSEDHEVLDGISLVDARQI